MAGPVASLALLLHGGDFSWTKFDVHWSTLIGTALFTGAYLRAVGPLRARHGRARTISPWRVASFLAGSVILVLSLNGPLHDLGDNFLFSAHMVQHLLLTLVVPPLWLIGTPDWLYRPLLERPAVRSAARVLTQPLVAFAIYNVIFAAWHVPRMYELALEHHAVHIVQHLLFIASAVLLWWPAVDPVPELSRMGPPLRLLYLFAIGVPMSVISALISLSGTILYPWYSVQPRVLGISPMDDQQLGGLIMWIPGGLVPWIAISIVFFRWANREEKEEEQQREPVPGAAGGALAR